MKKMRAVILLFFSVCLLISMVSCAEASKNESEFWFSENGTRFVPYDDEADGGHGNLAEAGNYWEMTVKKDCTLTISVRINTDFYSEANFFVNGSAVISENVSDTIYSCIYKNLSLKKGDKLILHAFWTNCAATNSNGFEISLFTISDGTGDYPINNIK